MYLKKKLGETNKNFKISHLKYFVEFLLFKIFFKEVFKNIANVWSSYLCANFVVIQTEECFRSKLE